MQVNIRKEVTEKHDVDEWCEACEVKISRHINYTVTKQASAVNGVEIDTTYDRIG